MTNPTTFERLKEIMETFLDIDPEHVRFCAAFRDDLGLDEVDMAELRFESMSAFGLEIADAELSNCSTVGDLVRLIDSKLSEAKEEEGAI